MEKNVYFAPLGDNAPREEQLAAFSLIMEKTEYFDDLAANELVGIKTHFGETADGDFIRPHYYPLLTERVRRQGGQPFLCETSVLYKSRRDNAPSHISLANEHGFTYQKMGMPIIMLDGLLGNQEKEVAINGELMQSVKLAADIESCNHIIVMSHVTGHIMTGMGACLKNMGMGMSSRKGKLQQHSGSKLEVVQDKCTACGLCIRHCPVDAITAEGADKKALIAENVCIGCGECLAFCRFGAIKNSWDVSAVEIQKKVAEYALGAWLLAGKKMVFFNFLVNVTEECDCMGKTKKIIPDIGIMASLDPVALDTATLDLVKEQTGKGLAEHANKQMDPYVQVMHGEKIGLGSRTYRLVEV